LIFLIVVFYSISIGGSNGSDYLDGTYNMNSRDSDDISTRRTLRGKWTSEEVNDMTYECSQFL